MWRCVCVKVFVWNTSPQSSSSTSALTSLLPLPCCDSARMEWLTATISTARLMGSWCSLGPMRSSWWGRGDKTRTQPSVWSQSAWCPGPTAWAHPRPHGMLQPTREQSWYLQTQEWTFSCCFFLFPLHFQRQEVAQTGTNRTCSVFRCSLKIQCFSKIFLIVDANRKSFTWRSSFV